MTLKKLVPLFDRILVRRIKAVEKTASGLYIPEKSQETINEGVVVAVGPGATNSTGAFIPVSLKEGNKVVLPSYGGSPVKINNEELLIFQEREILAKIE